MRRAATVLLSALAALAAPALADETLAPIDRLQARYEATTTMRAEFTQTVESPTIGNAITASGTVQFSKPNKMRWTYREPDAQVIVGDGTDMWFYQPDLEQVIRTPLSSAFESRTPIMFLAGLGEIKRDFDATVVGETDDAWELRLDPKGNDDLGVLTLVVRKSDASIAEARIVDALKTTTRLAFSNEERNVDIEAAEFRFVPPDGVDVVRPPTY